MVCMCANFISGPIDQKHVKTMAKITIKTLSKHYLPNDNECTIFLATWKYHAFFLLQVNMFLLLYTEHLSRRKTTNLIQSLTYKVHGAALHVTTDWNIDFREPNCSRTYINQTQTRLQVDLGKPYSISYVQIYRPDGRYNIFITAL